MERRLYPDLDPFYKFSNIEYGGQLEECIPDYPKLDTDELENQLDEASKLRVDSEETLLQRVPINPTAPPLTDTGGSLLESLYSYIMEELEPPPYSPNDPLSDSDTWTDDLQPDYDISADDLPEVPEINCLRVEAESNNNNNDSSQPQNDGNHRVVNNAKQSCVTRTHTNCDQVIINSDKGARNNKQNEMVIVTNRNLEAGDQHVVGNRSKINSEYGAWVTWRKNVNRQLATVILLRKGGHVYLQNSDLSRRPLSRTSIDYVIRNARKCNGTSGSGGRVGNAHGTSLNGTPYIMYGIPRVALSKSPPKRD